MIWDKRDLDIEEEWYKDGPLLPVEFTRISSNGRVTLIIDQEAEPVQVLWAKMTMTDVKTARESLRVREDCSLNRIHWIDQGSAGENVVQEIIKHWIKVKGIDGAIWSGLSFSERTNYQRPTIEAIIEHLTALLGEIAHLAETYVRRTPVQVATVYRARIEEDLGWIPSET